MATHYINWADARLYLDNTTVGDLNIGKLQALCEVAETEFDSRLRRIYDIPFVEAEDPESFDIAKKVCGMWAASNYLRQSMSAEGTSDDAWWGEELDRKAENLMTALEALSAPDDAEAAADPLQFTPYDGDPDRDAVFMRRNVAGGVSHHEDHW